MQKITKKHHLPTVTVAIPAFNEEANIGRLLKSVLNQTGEFVLERVIVICDGSTDSTPQIVEKASKMNSRVILIQKQDRAGKASRLNQVFALNRSDFVIVFDADILIPHKDIIERMLAHFTQPEIVLVSANNLPVKGDNFWGKLTQCSEELWYHARKNVNNGETYLNNSGCSFAIRKDFCKSFHLEPFSVHNQLYIFYEVAKAKKLFCFAKDAVIYYKTPSTWQDIISHHARSNSSAIIEDKINKAIGRVERVPRKLRIQAVLYMLARKPVYTLLTILYLKIMSLLPIKEDELNKQGKWRFNTSTKKY